jgi:putative ATPase
MTLQRRRDDEKLLHDCIRATLIWACKLKCESVAIPAISSGIFGFPKPLCSEILFKTVEEFALNIKASGIDPREAVSVRRIRFTNFDYETTDIFEREFVRRYV